MDPLCRIVRFYVNHPQGTRRRVIKRRVLLSDAQAWCNDPETSSTTCKRSRNLRRTRLLGPWFDGYERE